MRSCAVWLTVMGLLVVTTSTANAAPKKKRHKADTAAAADSGDTEAAPVEPAKSKSVDDMMDDSSKPSAAPKRAQASEPEEPAPSSEAVGEPDAWERPPADAPKPKKTRTEVAEVHRGDGRNINIGLLAGYGVPLGGSPFTSLNPYGFGVGLQGDYELESHLVLGVGGEFFIGNSNDMATNAPGTAAGTIMATYARYILGHAMVGYNIWFSNSLYLRPSLWVGAAIGLIPPSDTHLNGTVFSILLAPGLTLHYLLGTNGWYIGGDIHISMPLGHDGMTGLPLLATLGKRF